MNAKTGTIAALLIAPFACSGAWAESFRCGTHLIQEGMPAAEIAAKCGEPASKETVREPIMARRPNGSAFRVGETVTEHWIYDRGPGRFPVHIEIEEARAKKITRLPRN